MKTITKPVPEELSIVINVNPKANLIDRRLMSYGIVFGTIEQLASNYGVKLSFNDKQVILTAPKNRLQLLAEKLHFAKISYAEL